MNKRLRCFCGRFMKYDKPTDEEPNIHYWYCKYCDRDYMETIEDNNLVLIKP